MVVGTPDSMLLLVGCTILALDSWLILQAKCTAVEDYVFTEDSDDWSNQDCILKNMDYSVVKKLHWRY